MTAPAHQGTRARVLCRYAHPPEAHGPRGLWPQPSAQAQPVKPMHRYHLPLNSSVGAAIPTQLAALQQLPVVGTIRGHAGCQATPGPGGAAPTSTVQMSLLKRHHPQLCAAQRNVLGEAGRGHAGQTLAGGPDAGQSPASQAQPRLCHARFPGHPPGRDPRAAHSFRRGVPGLLHRPPNAASEMPTPPPPRDARASQTSGQGGLFRRSQ